MYQKNGGIARSWLVTWFAKDEEFDIALDELKNHVSYYIGQIERCPTTNKEHLQIFLNYVKPIRLTGITKVLKGAHCEASKYVEKSIEYCSKEDTRIRGPFSYGINPRERMLKGKKLTVKEALQKTEEELQEMDCYSYNVTKKAILNTPKLALGADDVRGIWITGPPGVGKSRFAREKYPGAYIKAQNKWWDGYNGEEAIILDDFDIQPATKEANEWGHYLKIWADRYPCSVEVKGSTVGLRHKTLIVTSNYTPDDIWPNGCMLIAVKRRFVIESMS